MKLTPLRPLTQFGRVSRSIILVALILGSLFPSVAGIGVATIASPLALLVVIYEIGRWFPRIHPVIVVPLLFLVVAIHAQVVPPLTEYGADKYSTWFTATLITAVAACIIRDEAALLTFSRTWLVASALLAVITIAGFAGNSTVARAEGFDSNPIWLARAMATGIIMALFLAMQGYIRAWLFVSSSTLLIAGIFATGSRGPILAVAIGAIALVFFTRHHRIRRIAGISIGAAGAYWAVTTLPFFQNSRIVTLLADGDTDLSRSIFWSVTPRLIGEKPEGVGIGNWALLADAPAQFFYPHNLFLEVFSELGVIIGIGLVAIIAVILVRLLVRARHTPLAILVFALLAAEIAQVSVSGDLNARTFWFLLTLGFLLGVRAVLPSAPLDPELEETEPAPTLAARPALRR